MASTRNTGKKARRAQQEQGVSSVTPYANVVRDVVPLNTAQQIYLDSIKSNDVVFGIGSAGTGKTYIAASYAAHQLYYKKVSKIILTRPNVETGPSLGHLPGELEEKYAPYLEPFEATLVKNLGKGFYDYCLKNKVIEPKPIGFMRGATFENAIVLIDEAQNLTKAELKMVLSRIGKNCKVILSGDPSQTDIKNSGLTDAVDRLSNGIPGIDAVTFVNSDIVRSRICKAIIMAYSN